ncbi:hypothetical protein [Kineosporia succinea]|uniref:Uncharacterized protein n=1 Tax=Kineosporia succinea TaxID=84632 RepID=A0ABT9PB70_9ACTN|nr:hypothetical protein [Kineosporia succinea]MDP9829946.1 hypothetical protein [Kineosporia succinea]
MPLEPIAAAVPDNVHWCTTICHSHDIPTTTDTRLWRSIRRSPAYCPDAITLRDSVAPADVIAHLDLTAHGFHVIIDAQWIWRASHPSPESPGSPDLAKSSAAPYFSRISRQADLTAWSQAHGTHDIVRPTLLNNPDIIVLAHHDATGSLTAGAILNRSPDAVGISNVFHHDQHDAPIWPHLTASAERHFPRPPRSATNPAPTFAPRSLPASALSGRCGSGCAPDSRT